MTSTLILYRDTKLTPERAFVVDSIEDYLSGITNKTPISDFQFQRFQLEMEIKLDLSQSYQEFNADYNYNYISIVNGATGRKVYYFIVKKRQIAPSTMAFSLLMDTANTFKWNVDFTPTNRTKVIREHKDRLQYIIPNDLMMKVNGIDYTENLTPGQVYSGSLHYIDDNEQDQWIQCKFYYHSSGVLHYIHIYISNVEDRRRLLEMRTSETIIFAGLIDEDHDYYFTFVDEVLISQLLEGCKIVRNVDYYSEGINPVLYKKELGELTEKANTSWNLIYRNAQNDDDAIACYILPDEDINALHTPTATLNISDFEDGKYYIIAPFVESVSNNYATPKQKVVVKDNDDVEYVARQISNWSGGWKYDWDCIAIQRVGAKLYIKMLYYSSGAYWNNTGMIFLKLSQGEWKEITSITYDDLEYVYYYKGDSIPPKTDITTAPKYFPKTNGNFSETPQYIELGTLQDVDRVDPKLVKIIKIPYFPTNYEYDEDEHAIIYDSTWSYVSNLQGLYDALQLVDLNTRFTSSITSEVSNPLSYNLINLIGFTPSTSDTRRADNYFESKLFHSDFYQVKFVYDSFSFTFALERISVDEYAFVDTSKFQFNFVMTSTINSKFMFAFPQYILRMSTEDYDNILPVARNNEAPIYNSNYITYLRTAYRYDLKELGQRQARTKAELGLNEWRTGISTFKNISDKDYGAVLTGLASFGVSVFTSIQDLQRNEWTLEAKMEQLKNQSASVSGSDDLDLMEAYANNKAKLVEYQCSERMRKLLADLFYYFGYTTNELKIPQLNTRVWFNYIACELELEDTGKNLPQDIIENLKERYSNGLTILHKVNGTWNFAQDKENWEVDLL